MRAGLAAIAMAMAVTGCNDSGDVAEDKMERAAEAQATAAGNETVALGLTELQLLDADLIGADNVELGDVVRIERDTAGNVDRLLIEIEDSNPDRFVHVPVSGLRAVARGNDTDLQTSMTVAELQALPEVKLVP
ncbi:PRC-barrel domain containing protein [Novosphingobium sp. M1R2S20]|uniref:PRC-barrel domain containing protein n=1 Tax=Novosphingobium rhizovicinum TaxID=3228928 RepID=A0ABV3RGT6_9SPHN